MRFTVLSDLTLPTLSTLALLSACSETPTSEDDSMRVQGRLTDTAGSQARFGGTPMDAATDVRGMILLPDGRFGATVMASVDADGMYTLEMPHSTSFMRVEALEADGDVVGSVMVEPAEGDRMASPMTTETSVEAAVFLDSEMQPDLWPDVRARIDARTAEAVRMAPDVDASVRALSDATFASHSAQVRSWRDAGLDVDELAMARLEATGQLSRSLHDGQMDAYVGFLDSLIAAEQQAGAGAVDHTDFKSHASIAFRATLEARGATELLDATASEAARIEGQAWEEASAALLTSMGASTDTVREAVQLAADLEADTRIATDTAQVGVAVQAWRHALLGSEDGSVLAEVLGDDLVTRVALDTAMMLAAEASVSTEAMVRASANAATMEADMDARAFGELVAQTMTDHRMTLREDLGAALNGPGFEGAVELIVDSHASFVGQ